MHPLWIFVLLKTRLCFLQDYWLSLLYKRLVGVKVLEVNGGTEEKRTTRVYAHCASRYKMSRKLCPVTLTPELNWLFLFDLWDSMLLHSRCLERGSPNSWAGLEFNHLLLYEIQEIPCWCCLPPCSEYSQSWPSWLETYWKPPTKRSGRVPVDNRKQWPYVEVSTIVWIVCDDKWGNFVLKEATP